MNAPRTKETRRLTYGSAEHQRREMDARDIHTSGAVTYYGSGSGSVMAVCRGKRRWVEIIGENGRGIWGEPFAYSNYFLRRQPDGAR